jgi:hypothetical protein
MYMAHPVMDAKTLASQRTYAEAAALCWDKTKNENLDVLLAGAYLHHGWFLSICAPW